MGITDYSTTPANNTTLSGIPVSDNTAVNAVDDLVRQLMADTREEYDTSRSETALDNAGVTTVGKAVATAADKAAARTAILEALVSVDASSGDVIENVPSAASVGSGSFLVYVRGDSSANSATLDADGSETINGQTTVPLPRGQVFLLWSDGSNYHGIERLPGRIASGEITSSLSQRVFALPANFREIKFSWYNADLATSGEVLQLQLGTGTVGSPTWRTTYVDVYVEGSNSAVTSAPQSLSSCPISTGLLAGYPSSGETLISGFNETQCLIRTQTGGVASGPAQRVLMRHARADAGGPFTVARVFASSGDIDGLHWTLDGIA